MTATPARLVSIERSPEPGWPAPDMSYEWRDRQRIAAKNWADIHVASDRRQPLNFLAKALRTWRA